MKFLVVGDVIYDEYVDCRPLGLSAETPTLVVSEERVSRFVGGAGLVARHLLRLGGSVSFLAGSVSSVDLSLSHLTSLARELLRSGTTEIEIERFFDYSFVRAKKRTFDNCMKPVVKRRYFAGKHKLFQVDRLNDVAWEPECGEEFVSLFSALADDVDAVVVCDNRHGALGEGVGRAIVEEARAKGKELLIDSQASQKESNVFDYAGTGFFFMNEREVDDVARSVRGQGLGRELSFVRSNLRGGTVVAKLGERGAACFDPEEGFFFVPTEKRDAVDTCGAGDAFLAAFASASGSIRDRIVAANEWAGKTVETVGTTVPGDLGKDEQ